VREVKVFSRAAVNNELAYVIAKTDKKASGDIREIMGFEKASANLVEF
jgi:hypothetical protein